MKTPVRAGTIASTLLFFLVICAIYRHSEYLRDRWDHIDEIKDEIAGGLRDHLGTGGPRTTIDAKYIGFGTPSPKPTTLQTPADAGFGKEIAPTPSAVKDAGLPETEDASADPDSGADEAQPTPSEAEVDGDGIEVVAEDEADTAVGDSAENELLETLPDKIVVMGKTVEEDTTWVGEHLPDWQHAVYSVDDLNATLHTPMNKGKEPKAMAYLTYLIENYGNYPSTVAFIHSHKDRFWHASGMPARSNIASLKVLNIDFVRQQGFTNLRCSLGPGCPAEVQPYRQETPDDRMYEKSMSKVWELFFGTPCPEVIAAPCCAQFAVSREQIMERRLEDYVLYRQWLMETDLDDDNSGRVFEYLWHVIFGQEAVHCPDSATCWANVYGGPSMAELHSLLYGGSA